MTQPIGYAGYFAVIAALPGTTKDIAARLNMTQCNAQRILSGLRSVGLVAYEVVVVATKWARRYRLQDGPRSGARPPARAIYLSSLWRALSEHGSLTINELADETGICCRQLQTLTTMMRSAKLVYRSGWRLNRNTYAALYAIGKRPDAVKPRIVSRKESNARHWAARKVRRQQMQVLHALAGTTERLAA